MYRNIIITCLVITIAFGTLISPQTAEAGDKGAGKKVLFTWGGWDGHEPEAKTIVERGMLWAAR